MDLIVQLGGYANAKFLISAMTEGTLMEFNGVLSNRQQLCEVLLAYRRQSNIFEDGDYYVYLHEWDSDLDIVCKFNPSEWSDHLWNIKNMIRHATDAEIKANRRLLARNLELEPALP